MNRTAGECHALAAQQDLQFACAPIGIAQALLDDQALEFSGSLSRDPLRPPAAFADAFDALPPIAFEPGVAGGTGNPKLLTKLQEGLFLPRSSHHKSDSLLSNFHDLPGHLAYTPARG